MKKILFLVSFLALAGICAFAASYTNNTYQKLAKEYTVKAEKALDAGEYLLAEEYAQKAQENAALSDAFIARMLVRETAEQDIALAKNRIDYVKSIKGDVNFPIAFEEATKLLAQAEEALAGENFENASGLSRQIIDVLAQVYEIIPLPKYYIVRPWATHKDCFWNISGKPFVYNNPFLWENLYEANKSALPKPEDPNLIMPGMKMEIPSLTGEYRDGVYSPDIKYEPYKGK
jgi:nucleoid-associated protein YgaU